MFRIKPMANLPRPLGEEVSHYNGFLTIEILSNTIKYKFVIIYAVPLRLKMLLISSDTKQILTVGSFKFSLS